MIEIGDKMTNWNHDRVKQLADMYDAAGLGNTSSGRFLRSLAIAGSPPRGGGITWLEQILTKGDPAIFIQKADEVAAMIPMAGTYEGRLHMMVKKLREVNPLADWEEAILTEIKVRDVTAFVKGTPLQQILLRAAFHKSQYQSPTYWSRRTGILNRLHSLFTANSKGSDLPAADWEWLEKTFKGVHRDLQLEIADVGELRFWHDPTTSTWCTIFVTGDPYYDLEIRDVCLPCIVKGVLRSMPIKALSKRMPRNATST